MTENIERERDLEFLERYPETDLDSLKAPPPERDDRADLTRALHNGVVVTTPRYKTVGFDFDEDGGMSEITVMDLHQEGRFLRLRLDVAEVDYNGNRVEEA